MAVSFTKKKKVTTIDVLTVYFDNNKRWETTIDPLEILVKIVASIRPKNLKKTNEIDLTDLLLFLKKNKSITNQFSSYLKGLLFEKKISRILSDAAILQDVDFLFEVKKRIYARILPYQHEPDTLEFVLNQVFYLDSDPI